MSASELTEAATIVFQAARTLPPKVREQLADELWASLDEDAPCDPAELTALQLEEVRRRLDDYRKGREASYSVEGVQQHLRSGSSK